MYHIKILNYMAVTIEYKESVVHHDSTLIASFDDVRENVPQRNEESTSKSKRKRLTVKFEWKDETVETLIILRENHVNNSQYRRCSLKKVLLEISQNSQENSRVKSRF